MDLADMVVDMVDEEVVLTGLVADLMVREVCLLGSGGEEMFRLAEVEVIRLEAEGVAEEDGERENWFPNRLRR